MTLNDVLWQLGSAAYDRAAVASALKRIGRQVIAIERDEDENALRCMVWNLHTDGQPTFLLWGEAEVRHYGECCGVDASDYAPDGTPLESPWGP